MRRITAFMTTGLLAALSCESLCGQVTGRQPSFEVATIKPVSSDQIDDSNGTAFLLQYIQQNLRVGEIPTTGPDRVRLQKWTLREIVAAAYRVRSSHVSGPDWLSHERFDVEANVPIGTPKDKLNDMLQALLEDRFALHIHKVEHNEQCFALVVEEGGPKLTPAASSGARSQELTQEEQMDTALKGLAAQTQQRKASRQSSPASGFNSRFWPSLTLEELAKRLEPFTSGIPVVDETGLMGKYAVRIEVSNDPDSDDTIFAALQKLGLKLERRKIPMETVVVDQISKTPTPN